MPIIVASLARVGSALQVARLRLAPGSRGSSPPLARSWVCSPFDVAVADSEAPTRTETPPELLRDRHRSMPSAGAAEGDRHVRLSLPLEPRQRKCKQILDSLGEFGRVVIPQHEPGDVRIEPGVRAQRFDEIG